MEAYTGISFIVIFVACTVGERLGCPQICKCPDIHLCPPGTPMVLDPCGCGCRVCIQELGAECDGLRPCDPTKNLTCDYQGDPDRQRGLCKETEEDPVPPTDPPMCKTNTDWTPCSRSCGFGNSVRITYEKESCTPKVERRLCMIRPCKGQYASANYTDTA
ncbi:CCN family member 2-like isoform X3 [Pseudophryne corroboree]|uniref:CCN family member 2-like isoform X3 n=1 Tax=Pseudophryne corroboree TaxID=495146 RepID=UPI003081D001